MAEHNGNLDDTAARQEELSTRFGRLEARVAGIAEMLGDVKSAMVEQTRRLADRDRAPWGHLIAGAGVIVALGGVILTLVIGPIVSMLTEIKMDAKDTSRHEYAVNEAMLSRIERDGDKLVAARVTADDKLERRVDALAAAVKTEFGEYDTAMQREMRLLDAAMAQQITDLSARLQAEIGRAERDADKQRDALAVIVEELAGYQRQSRPQNAAQEVRLWHLERQSFGEQLPRSPGNGNGG
ncbi:MAG: hypothetical protein U0990_09365 [Candidatus Nanopelagicales bacterium]|nr:hypothetical protein [Candidatus Nanopelagicales bacterium]